MLLLGITGPNDSLFRLPIPLKESNFYVESFKVLKGKGGGLDFFDISTWSERENVYDKFNILCGVA